MLLESDLRCKLCKEQKTLDPFQELGSLNAGVWSVRRLRRRGNGAPVKLQKRKEHMVIRTMLLISVLNVLGIATKPYPQSLKPPNPNFTVGTFQQDALLQKMANPDTTI
ncbi:hypothetical protein TNCT_272261 [Trichonephila clavata]|uniref:Uncharacterized protein n=1 Tax=Trichonephila clavata TaxID=2740835 RepID=A0A8X6GBC0_TRICU|nr:hypothetical protein TNCT_272261 [Trichonephila clavata]